MCKILLRHDQQLNYSYMEFPSNFNCDGKIIREMGPWTDVECYQNAAKNWKDYCYCNHAMKSIDCVDYLHGSGKTSQLFAGCIT